MLQAPRHICKKGIGVIIKGKQNPSKVDMKTKIKDFGETEQPNRRISELEKLVDERTGMLNDAQGVLQKQAEQLKAARKALSSYEARYALVIEGASDGLWDRDLTNDKVYFSPRWKKMLGFEDDEFPNDYNALIKRIHPDDLKRVKDTVQRHFVGETGTYPPVVGMWVPNIVIGLIGVYIFFKTANDRPLISDSLTDSIKNIFKASKRCT